MLVYLDVCCFNRPFDDQSQLTVRLETEAKLWIQDSIHSGRLSLAWSAIIDLENNANPDPDRRDAIAQWRQVAQVDVATTDSVENMGKAFVHQGLKGIDALHVASALEGGAEYFLTTDRAILRKLQDELRLRVLDPVDFVRECEGYEDEV